MRKKSHNNLAVNPANKKKARSTGGIIGVYYFNVQGLTSVSGEKRILMDSGIGFDGREIAELAANGSFAFNLLHMYPASFGFNEMNGLWSLMIKKK